MKRYRVTVETVVTAKSEKKVDKLIERLWKSIQTNPYCDEHSLSGRFVEVPAEGEAVTDALRTRAAKKGLT
jgi:hypothetical protein